MAKRRKKTKKKKYATGGSTSGASGGGSGSGNWIDMVKDVGSAYYGGIGLLANDIKSIKKMKVDAKTGAMYKKGGIIQHD